MKLYYLFCTLVRLNCTAGSGTNAEVGGEDDAGPRNLSQPAAALAAILAGELALLRPRPASPVHPSTFLLVSPGSPGSRSIRPGSLLSLRDSPLKLALVK